MSVIDARSAPVVRLLQSHPDRLTDYAGYPLISDFGIEVDRNDEAESALSLRFHYDCVFAPGTVLTVAGRQPSSS